MENDTGGPLPFEKMVADHMDAGFLENIADMIRQDKNHFSLIPFLISDQRQRVRIGAVALVETFLPGHRPEISGLIPQIALALKGPDAAARADAAYMLSVIGDPGAIPYLKEALSDGHMAVRESAAEAIRDLLPGAESL